MAKDLIIPGVSVRTEFEPVPPLPSVAGVLGVVGVTDRGPLTPVRIGSYAEFIETFGPASRFTLPELRDALANGITRAVVCRLAPAAGRKATLTLMDADGEAAMVLEARAEGAWGRTLAAKVTEVRTLGGQGVKYINLEILLNGAVVERHDGLVSDPNSPDYMFARINNGSALVTAIDPVFGRALPPDVPQTALAEADGRAAQLVLQAGGADVVTVAARRQGRAGNRTSVTVRDGRAGLVLTGAGDEPMMKVTARAPGTAGTGFRVTVSAAPGGTTLVVTPPGGAAPRNIGPATTLAELVAGFDADPDLSAAAIGTALPAVAASAPLARQVTLEVVTEGQDTRRYEDLPDLAAIQAIDDSVIRFTAVEGATALPDTAPGAPLSGGRARGRALAVEAEAPTQPLVEFVPADNAPDSIAVRLRRGVSTLDNATAVVDLDVFVDGTLTATFANLTMDPDDENYLPAVLQGSGLVEAVDLFVRSGTTALPMGFVRPRSFDGGGDAVSTDDYLAALERMEQAEEVDLVLASVANQLDDAGVRTVHRQIVAHCSKMAGPARNRIGFGSVTASEQGSTAAMIDHANDVRSDHFALVAPSGIAPAFVGLLGRLEVFESPTFKTLANPAAPPGAYSDAELEQLVSANVVAVNSRRQRGTIAIKGILTSGRQINVQRTVNKAVRDIDAIAQKFIGKLNNEGNRTALNQQVFALLGQMERDGALVPSTNGSDPAFKTEVSATQDDFAKGIVRVSVALRPVRAIDYIYVTIFVQN